MDAPGKGAHLFYAIAEHNSLGQPVRLIASNGQITELTINDANHLTQIHYGREGKKHKNFARWLYFLGLRL